MKANAVKLPQVTEMSKAETVGAPGSLVPPVLFRPLDTIVLHSKRLQGRKDCNKMAVP